MHQSVSIKPAILRDKCQQGTRIRVDNVPLGRRPSQIEDQKNGVGTTTLRDQPNALQSPSRMTAKTIEPRRRLRYTQPAMMWQKT